MARKKDERAIRRKEKKTSETVDSDSKSLSVQLSKIGLKVRDVIGDGNCLFRALADQLDGDDRAHGRHRQDVVRYMKEHRSDFEPFIEDDVPFEKHMKNLAEDGTYAGNDAIVAFARLHKLTVIIHQLGSPAWEVHGEAHESSSSSVSSGSVALQLHILYHSHEHYSSVRRIDDDSVSPANVRIMPARPLPPTPPCIARSRNKPDLGTKTVDKTYYYPDQSLAIDEIPDYASEFVANVLVNTKCRNESLVRDLCIDAGYYDIDFVCSQVFAIMDESLPSSPSASSSQSDIDQTPSSSTQADNNTNVSGAKPKARQQHTANRRQRKQEKKARAALRRKQDVVGSVTSKVTSSDEDDPTPYVITENIKVLQI